MTLWEVLVSIFWFMLLVAWFWLLMAVIADLFRNRSLSGVAKAAWCLFVVLIPWLGVLMYMLVRGPAMNDRAARETERSQEALRQQMRPPTVADDVGRLADLHDRGKISAAEFEAAKRQLLDGAAPERPTVAT
jgi:hypothetical protein